MRARLALALLALAAGCSRGPDEAALKSDVEQTVGRSFKPGVLELAGVKRQGSSPLPAGESGAPRVVVYFNATLRLREGYDFKDWEALSPATLANALGGREKGVIGVKAKEHQPGDLLRIYGSAIYEQGDAGWKAVAASRADTSPAPAEPGSAAPATESQRYLERLAAQVNLGPPGIDARTDKIISEELEHALRAIARRRARVQEIFTFVSGPAAGEYRKIAEAIIGTAAKARRGAVRVLAVETEGSIENARLLGRGEADLALVQSDVAWLALNGSGPFAVDGPQTRLAALASLYPEPIHIVVAAASPIRNVEDLRGKRVDLGTPNSGSRLNAVAVLAAHRIALKDLAEARGQGAQAAAAALRGGKIDAFFVTIGAPARGLQQLVAGFPVRLVPITAAAADRMLAERPGLVRLTLPANTYPGQAEAVPTLAATALLLGMQSTPDDEVKALLELAFESTDYLAFGSAQGVRIAKATGLRGIAIPLHPAAAAYFQRGAR